MLLRRIFHTPDSMWPKFILITNQTHLLSCNFNPHHPPRTFKVIFVCISLLLTMAFSLAASVPDKIVGGSMIRWDSTAMHTISVHKAQYITIIAIIRDQHLRHTIQSKYILQRYHLPMPTGKKKNG
ncbi:hypothetical protein BO94DRAFT_357231 [Aspergillus sclerotioniger CBS 115572]|uniref:Uncharacterized protein n=1 Tax=Aspergillus sclerotioniger CBS 115572 TaxID=1450535 RepID=A0A317X2V9_9EURO|nr:hypothetical protein BO94DRAFT_357231 [Aspergillus sclerotioniger CBS 115572]PWY92959.1 hypothetical protein BO94DRAFT_357231 [Aspergillus sclerotioniger CBS 115572]